MSLYDFKVASAADKVYDKEEHPVWEVTFYSKVEESTAAMIAAGAPTYQEVDYIRMLPRGQTSPTTIYDRKVDFEGMPVDGDGLSRRLPDPARFPYEWVRYKEGINDAVGGLSLSFANFLNKDDMAFYKSRGINTIEQLGAATYETLRSLGGKAEKHAMQAKDFLKKNESLKALAEVTEENRAIKESNEQLAAQLAKLQAQVAALDKNQSDDDVITTRKRKIKDDI
jgi:hypothetical protein